MVSAQQTPPHYRPIYEGVERKRRCLAECSSWEGAVLSFRSYGQPLVMLTSFWYMGWTLITTDDDWPEVIGNLCKAIKTWVRPSRVLGREVADVWSLVSLCLPEV